MQIMKAWQTYTKGTGMRSTWKPLPSIRDALDEAFYAAYDNVVPSGKRTLLAVDVSGSMTMHSVAGMDGMTARSAAAAMALVTAATEPRHEIVAFSAKVVPGQRDVGYGNRASESFFRDPTGWACQPLDISPRMRMDAVMETMRDTQAGGTDCAMPMLYALENEREVDTFVIYTDNETWAGSVHPTQALQRYRAESGIPARLVCVAMSATDYSVADPNDPLMLDVVGLDPSAPALIAAFARGEV
jgi:60 kDa SS-A/Ro ribonucleoprotein